MKLALPERSFCASAKGPLSGIRVLDLSSVLVGNALTMQLGDYGAEVIKIERPGAGDGLRAITEGGIPVYWKVLSRNKKSVAVDLKHPSGVEIVRSLAKRAHVLVENFRPGVLERLGFSTDALLEDNPKLVIVRASGWGATGPYRHKPGFGTLIEAFSGFAAKSGFPDGPPLLPNLGLADLVCALNGAFATIVALREAEREGGAGQIIDLSILDSMAALLGPDPITYAATEKIIERIGNGGAVAAPRNLYLSADGAYLAMSCSTQRMTERLFEAIGRPELIDDPRYADNSQRVKHHKELDEIVQRFVGQKTLAENLAFFEARGITVGPVNTVKDFVSDEHVVERGIVFNMDDPVDGMLPMPAPAARLSRTPAEIRTPAPALGEHSEAVLKELGFSPAEIGRLVADGVVEMAARR